MKTLIIVVITFVLFGLTIACSLTAETPVSKLNPFIGNWAQSRLSDHPLGMGLCGNYQNIKFLDNGTFILTNDYSGVYKSFDFGSASQHPKNLEGTYKILSKDQIELVFKSDGQSEAWKYVFSGNDLTMSFNPTDFPDETGSGDIPCYFTESKE